MITPQMLMLLQGDDRLHGVRHQGFDRRQGVVRPQGVSALGNIPSHPARDSLGFNGVGGLYDGAREGMRSVRDLTGASEEDQRRGIGMGLMRLFSGMGKTGYGSGIRGTLGALAQNIPEAMSSYQGHLDKKRNQNMEDLKAFMAEQNELREYNRKLLDMEDQQNKWRREQHEKHRHNLAQEANWGRMAKGMSYGSGSVSPALLSQLPRLEGMPAIASKQEHSQYVRDRKNFGQVLSELKSIRSDWSAFRELSKDDLIDPQTPYGLGDIANATSDFMGALTNHPQRKQQTAKRKALEAKLGKFNVELERKLKGGVLSDSMRRHFENKGILPSLADRADVFEDKLSDLEHEISNYERAATLALQTGRALSPWDLEEMEGADTSQAFPQEREEAGFDIDSDQAELDAINAQLAQME